MKILIDNGYGVDTKGKRSPDGRLLEYAENRLLAGRIVSPSRPRATAPSSWYRKTTMSAFSSAATASTASATPSAKRMSSSSPSIATLPAKVIGGITPPAGAPTPRPKTLRPTASPPASTTPPRSTSPTKRLRLDLTDGDPDIEASFYLLRHTSCPAVLTENLFMDNQDDVEYLLSDIGQTNLVNLYVTGINLYLGIH